MRKLDGFQEISFGRTLVVSFWLIPLVRRVQGYGIRRRKIYISGKKSKRRSIRAKVYLYEVCVNSIFFILFFILL